MLLHLGAPAEPPSEFLSKAELKELTDYARAKAQARWLMAEGIPHQVRGSRVIVSRMHVRAWVEGRSTRPSQVAINGSNPARKSRDGRQSNPQQHAGVRRAALWGYYGDVVDKIDTRLLACLEFQRIPTEGRAIMHFSKCDACRAIRARYFPSP